MMMMRRWNLTATAHQMAAVPNAFAHNAWVRFGSGRRKRHDRHGEQDERYEFAHRSILGQSRTSSAASRGDSDVLGLHKKARRQTGPQLTESGYTAVTRVAESKKPSRNDWAKCLNLLVPERGIEPPTFALRMRCSTV